MADQEIAQIFQQLSGQLANVSVAVGTQGIAQIVFPFDGDSKNFKTWIKSIEKFSLLTGLNDERKKLVAYQSSHNTVSDFIQRYLKDNANSTWDQLKTELTARFAEITDPQHAFMLLRSVKQRQGENVQLFAERLLTLAEEAFVGSTLN